MRLIQCYIENFGKISKKEFSFNKGLNCIREDNGSGKTTLAAFIKVMLYGMSDTKKASLEENDRKHYLPWQGGSCGGSLTFESGGKIYRVERSFAQKAADDTVAVYDTATGRLTDEFTDGVGETLFGINADGFERTVFLSERALSPKSDNRSISAKLSDLVGCDGDIGGMDDAMKRLEEKRKYYYKRGGSGELEEIKSRIDAITRRLDGLVEVEGAMLGARGKMTSIAENIEKQREIGKELIAEIEKTREAASEANYERQIKQISDPLDTAMRQRAEIARIFGANIPTFPEIDEAGYKLTESRAIMTSLDETDRSREIEVLAKSFEGRIEKAQIESARAAISELHEIEKLENSPEVKKARKIFSGRVPSKEEINKTQLLLQKEKSFPIGIIIGCAVFGIIAVLGLILNYILSAVGVIGIIGTIAIHLVLKSKKKKEKNKLLSDFFLSVSGVSVTDESEMADRLRDMLELLDQIESMKATEEKEKIKGKISDFVILFPDRRGEDKAKICEEIIADYDRYAELILTERYKAGERSTRIERAERLRRDAEMFIARYSTRSGDPIGELRAALTEYERLTADILAKRSEIERLQNLHSLGESSQREAQIKLSRLNAERAKNDEEIANLSREYALTERLYLSYSDELEEREQLIMDRGELEERLSREKENYDTILLTKKYITLAKDNMTVRYLGKTKAGFLRYAELIGGITGESFEMDTDFGITKQDSGATRQIEAYSKGTRDLFNLATRLGLIDALYENEKPPIILDDPFTAFDDDKTSKATRVLREISKERQIIYFTCSKSRSV